MPDGSEHTYAEMTDNEKNSDSPRKRAFEELRNSLNT
ncbi:hypothetical protein CO180_00045 [candidate division WWE3 bacterium CG_4_9_14_3_um_filter_41_6]|uniref:Uncharacterized protein n=1 Tax=candidate division WWE3 bacterium CG_4_10_14_0_2_um_filter_41_14 TaxID=1975072 RepID=A0A2M7TI62_UNCKA|nr:MAG: hypothetical protein COY32_04195 [candidate division WWE3 bacterium CG_4_10_14_0_2_um_filter_41_14]PJA39737.1 MAG: hypothetical protein CO180_00045 [candidate division WWE3 bacterium CG_4_9_14_3_um_filter_41_6]